MPWSGSIASVSFTISAENCSRSAADSDANSSAMASSRGLKRLPRRLRAHLGQFDHRRSPVGGMRPPYHQLRLLERIHEGRHVPRRRAELLAKIAHDGWAAAVQRLQQPQARVAKAVTGSPFHPANEVRGEPRRLTDKHPPALGVTALGVTGCAVMGRALIEAGHSARIGWLAVPVRNTTVSGTGVRPRPLVSLLRRHGSSVPR